MGVVEASDRVFTRAELRLVTAKAGLDRYESIFQNVELSNVWTMEPANTPSAGSGQRGGGVADGRGDLVGM